MLINLVKLLLKRLNPQIIIVSGNLSRHSVVDSLYAIYLNNLKVIKNNKDNFDSILESVVGFSSRQKGFLRKIHFLFFLLKALFVNNKRIHKAFISIPLENTNLINKVQKIFVGYTLILTDDDLLDNDLWNPDILKKNIAILVSKAQYVIFNGDSNLFVNNNYANIKKLTFGLNRDNSVIAEDLRLQYRESNGLDTLAGVNIKLTYNGNTVPFSLLGVVGKIHIYGFLGVVSYLLSQGNNLVEISDYVGKLKPIKSLFTLLDGIKHSLIIDHSLGASVSDIYEGLDILKNVELEENRDKFVIIGDIEGLGRDTESIHQEIGSNIAGENIDYLILIGEKSRDIKRGARNSGMDEHKVFYFENTEQAKKFVQDRIEKGDLLFIIGSEKIHLEYLILEIMAKPRSAPEQVARITSNDVYH